MSFDGDGGPSIVTIGAVGVDFEADRRAFAFARCPRPLFSVANAVNECLPDGSALLSVADHSRRGRRRRRWPLRSRLRRRAPRLRCFRSPSPRTTGVVSFDGVARPHDRHDRRFGVDFEGDRLAFAFAVAEAARSPSRRREACVCPSAALCSTAPTISRRRPSWSAFATSLAPSNTCTTTSVFSLAVPENDGVVLFDGDAGATIVTTGDSVLTSKPTAGLLPSPLPSPLFSVATAVNACLPVGSALLSVAAHFPPTVDVAFFGDFGRAFKDVDDHFAVFAGSTRERGVVSFDCGTGRGSRSAIRC